MTDIQTHKQAEEVTLHMAAIVESSIDPILSKTVDGIVTSWNKAAERTFGYSAAEMVGQSILKIIPQDRIHEEAAILSQIRQGKIIEHMETVRVTKSGVSLLVNLSISPILDRAGQVIGVAKMIRDVTALRQAEAELARLRAKQEASSLVMESEAKFRGAFDNSPIGILLLYPDGRWQDVNQAFCEMLGYSKSELLATAINDHIPAEDRVVSSEAREKLFSGQINNLSVEKHYIHRKGHRVPVWMKGSAIFDSQGRPKYLMAQVLDITDRKNAETQLKEKTQQLKKLIDTSPAGIFATDENLNVTIWNPACERMFGWSESEAVGSFIPFIPANKRDEAAAISSLVHSTPKPIFKDLERVRKDGSPIQIHSAIMSLTNQGQKSAGLMAVVLDMTAHALAQTALKEGREAAESANRTKSEFLANMSHEIRTPMNGVIGMAGLLADTALTSEQQVYVGAIKSSGESLLTVINDILDFSKIEAGKLTLESVSFDIRQVMADIEEIFSIAAKNKSVDLGIVIAENVPTFVRADFGRLRQILTNLIGNALKFTSVGSVEIQVSCGPATPMGCDLKFEISDSGIGISEIAQKKLFSSFQQAESDTSRKFGGTGLGLVISKRLVELMGGQISFRSTEGVGTKFSFTIAVELERLTVLQSLSSKDFSILPKLRGRVLVADDNQINQIIALRMLEKLGCQGTAVANGLEVLQSLKQFSYDCILMDCQMPELDGFETTIAIRAMERRTGEKIPIVAMTANAMAGDQLKCLAAGMDDYVSKPVALAKFAAVLSKWIRCEELRAA